MLFGALAEYVEVNIQPIYVQSKPSGVALVDVQP